MINYDDILSVEQKKNILNNRISQLIIEGYQNSVGMKVAINLNDQERIDQIQNILNIIEVSLLTHKQELDLLTESDTEEKSE